MIDQTPDSEARPTSSTRQDEATTPLTTRSNIETTSSSSKKLRERIQSYSKDLENSEGNDGFVIFSIGVLQDVFSFICCPGCKQESVALEEVIEKKQGLAINFRLKCSLCLWQHQFFSSPYANVPCKKSKNSMEVNVRLAMAFRNAGIGYDTLENVCTHMNMHKPMTKNNYLNVINSLHEGYVKEAANSMKRAAEEVKETEMSKDVAVSFDGSWQKPGYASLNGIVSAISVTTGKVLDYQVKSKRCKGCEIHEKMDKTSEKYLKWKLNHAFHCGTNHVGSSGAMEVGGVKEMYERSVEKNDLRYVSFIGDGDSSTYQTISNAKPYGDDVPIVKKECVGHVQKRLGTRLRKLKSGKKKLSDGKGIRGRNRLTDKMLDTMQNYYGLAIRQNKNNLEGMTNDVKAGLYHLASSEQKPQHHLCPKGKESWCGWQKDVATKTKSYKPKRGLPTAVVDAIEPIYEALADKNYFQGV